MPLSQQGVVTEATLSTIRTRMGVCGSQPDIVSGTRQELLRALEKKGSLSPELQKELEALATDFGRAHPTAE